ncbi:MAG: GPW/gp25 family protein [Candidatus Heimdallarchaeaceae archaeon]
MANLLDRFNEAVAGSNSKLADYTSKVAAKGDFRRINNIEVLISSWNNILITPRRTYMFDPDYGSDLYKMVFEPADEITVEKVVEEVTTTLLRYDDRATIENVNVTFFTNQKGFSVAVDVNYQGDTGQLAVVVDESIYFKFFESTEVQ